MYLIPVFNMYGAILANALSMFIRIAIVIYLAGFYKELSFSVFDHFKIITDNYGRYHSYDKDRIK